MALRNGLLVHGPDALGRGRPRRRRQRSRSPPGPKPRVRGGARPACPACAAWSASARRWPSSRSSSARCREARLPFQDATVARRDGRRRGSPAWRCAGARAGSAARPRWPRSRWRPSLVALRGGDLAAYHGVEHKAIGAYEQGADDAARRDQGARPLRLAPDGAAAGRQPGRHRAAAPRRRAPVAAGRRRGPARLDRRRGRGLRVVRAPRATPRRRARCAGPGTSSSACWARASRPTSSSRSAAPRWPRSCASKRCAELSARRLEKSAETADTPGVLGVSTLLAVAGDAAQARQHVLEVIAGLPARLVALTAVPPAPSVLERVRDFANNWQAVFAILFMVALIVVLWRTLKLMPQTKPIEIKPEANLEVGWEDIAGVDEAKAELREVVEFLRDPKQFERLGRARCPRASCCTGRPAPARRCWPRPWPTSPARTSSRSRPRRSSRCSPASAPRASAACSARRASSAARDHLHRRARRRRRPPRHRTTTPSASRRSTSCWSRWTASPRPRRAASSSWPPRTCSRSSTRRCCAPGASTARSSSRRPTSRAASGSCAVHTANKPLREDVDLDVVAQQTSGLTGADLANICNEAAIFCGAPRGPRRLARGLRRRDRARHRRRAVLHDAQRARAPRRRLPRGRPRAVPRAARRRRPRAQDLDRPARQRARLRGQPARRGLLPEDARGARRPDDGAARRPRRRADRLRRGHHRRRQRPPARRGDHPRDDPPVRDGLRRRAAGARSRTRRSRTSRAASATRSSGAGLRGAPRRRGTSSPPTASCSTRSPPSCSRTRCSSAPQIDRIMEGVPRLERRRPAAGPAHRRGREARRRRAD